MISDDQKTISMWWPQNPQPGNMGDILSPWIVNKITGLTGTYVDYNDDATKLVAIGSVIARIQSGNCIVWGSGLIREEIVVQHNTEYLAVRGPLTRDILLSKGCDVPDVYGDPALLLPYLHHKAPTRKYKHGIFPHYVDYADVKMQYKGVKDVKIIYALHENPINVVNDILDCDHIISSSLHGVIVAQAYGIPATWVKFSDKLDGDDIKFHDYFASVGLACKHISIDGKLSTSQLFKLPKTADISFNKRELKNALTERVSRCL